MNVLNTYKTKAPVVPQVQQEIESTFEIKLFNGLIKGKSQVDLKKLVFSMDTNLKNALSLIVLNHLGLNVSTDGDIEVKDEDKAIEFVKWLKEKQSFQATKQVRKISLVKEKTAVADTL